MAINVELFQLCTAVGRREETLTIALENDYLVQRHKVGRRDQVILVSIQHLVKEIGQFDLLKFG